MMSHRGPDGTGFYVKDNIALGHKRLAIIDLSGAGNQPMSNEDDSLHLVYNGEIYNFIELREELLKNGHIFKSVTDAEVILHSFEEWGKECLNRFNGMWSFVIWDEKKKELFCSRDRFGVKPFYYLSGKDLFVFASEIKPLLKFIKSIPNDVLIYDFLKTGIMDHTDETFFQGIKKLPAACFARVSETGEMKIKKYWDFKVSERLFSGADDEERGVKIFSDLFTDSVKLRLRSDVPVGSCLSGGLDSSAVVCTMSELLKGKGDQKTYSSCFEDPRVDERKYIEEVAEKTKAEKNYVFPGPKEFLEELDKILFHQEEPFAGTSIYAQWRVIKEAKKSVKVLLDGQGGDELLLGYRKFYFFHLKNLLKNKKYLLFFKEALAFFSSLQTLRTINFKSGLRYFKLGGKIQGIDNLLSPDFKKRFSDRKIDFSCQKDISQRIKEDIAKYSLPVLLRYEDKNSMAHGIETRLPFLDYRLVEKVSLMPFDLKLRNGWSKFILRKAMKGALPEKIRLRKSKLGFATPEESWMKREMKSDIKKTIENCRFIIKYINKKELLKALDNFFSGKSFISSGIIFRFYILEKWGRKFIYEK